MGGCFRLLPLPFLAVASVLWVVVGVLLYCIVAKVSWVVAKELLCKKIFSVV